VTLGTRRYDDRPLPAHAPLGLQPAHFERWLALFEATAREVCPPDAAEIFVERARRIAESFQIGLGIGAKAVRVGACAR
jgi:hemoglobin